LFKEQVKNHIGRQSPAGRFRSRTLAARLTQPTLIVNGRSDLVFRADERAFLNRLRRAGAPARITDVRGGHLFPLRDPQAFTDLVRQAHSDLTGRRTQAGP